MVLVILRTEPLMASQYGHLMVFLQSAAIFLRSPTRRSTSALGSRMRRRKVSRSAGGSSTRLHDLQMFCRISVMALK